MILEKQGFSSVKECIITNKWSKDDNGLLASSSFQELKKFKGNWRFFT